MEVRIASTVVASRSVVEESKGKLRQPTSHRDRLPLGCYERPAKVARALEIRNRGASHSFHQANNGEVARPSLTMNPNSKRATCDQSRSLGTLRGLGYQGRCGFLHQTTFSNAAPQQLLPLPQLAFEAVLPAGSRCHLLV